MRFAALADSGLGISHEDVATVFAPFVARFADADDPEWRVAIERRKRKILRKYLKRLLLGWLPANQRDENAVINEYAKAWQEREYDNYSLIEPPPRISPWEWHEQRMFASDVGATRFRQLILSRWIERLKPQRVLEVGCGNGINLFLLACRFPEIEFTGIELTQQGHQAATAFQRLPSLPTPMQDYAPLPLVDTTAFREIRFLQGNAAALPLEDSQCDVVLTVLALEQMERLRPQALSELARVTRRYVLMFEPFRDVNDKGWARRNVIRRNYFRGRIGDLPAYGLEPLVAIDDFPQEAFLKACLVLAEKR